jgi:hypothetical protein
MKNLKTITRFSWLLIIAVAFYGCGEDDVVVVGSAPDADAGSDLTSMVGATVTLDGSGSSDADGDPLTYNWELVTVPSGSSAAISNGSQAVSSFVPDVAGTYTARLAVNDGNNADQVDEATITVAESTGETVIVDANITSNTTWVDIFEDPTIPDYRVVINVSITNGATLTIEPGVTVEFESDRGMSVNGALVADGNASAGILFTGVTKQKGFWKGVAIFSPNINNLLNYVTVEYGGSSDVGSGIPKVNVGVENGDKVKITNSTFRNSTGYGLFLESGSIIEEFSNNSFNDNDEFPLGLAINNIGMLDQASTFTANTNNEVAVFGSTLNNNSEEEWKNFNDNTAFRVLGKLELNSGLLISEGTTMRFESNVGLEVSGADGYLIAKGTTSEKVVFTGVTEAAGFWQGIVFFTNNVKNELDHTIISYGGSSAFGAGVPQANVGIENGDRLKISNSEIFGSGDYGIYFESGSLLSGFENNILRDNTGFPLALTMSNATKIDANSTFNIGNGDNTVEVLGNTLNEGATEVSLTELSNNTSYYLTGNLSIRSGLVFEDGVKIEVATDNLIDVSADGYLIADGTAGNGISISGKTKSPGVWRGIAFFTNDVRNLMDFVTVSHGGSSNVGSGIPKVNVGVENGDKLTITNCTITDCDGTGLFGEAGSTVTQSGNSFSNNVTDIDLN